jgi:hypothetical protein
MSRSVFTLFSDDIRQEVGGKITYVGTYTGSMQVPEFPATLPKFCISVFCCFDSEKPIASLHMKVLLGEQVLADEKFSPNDQPSKHERNMDTEHPEVVQANLFFTPLQIPEPCSLRVEVNADGENLQVFPFKISTMDDESDK